jgi:hypothetical protein
MHLLPTPGMLNLQEKRTIMNLQTVMMKLSTYLLLKRTRTTYYRDSRICAIRIAMHRITNLLVQRHNIFS